MRVLIINPTLDGESFSQHLGITSLASYINARTSHQAELVDFGFRRKNWQSYLREKIARFEPDAFGVSVSSPMVAAARTVINELNCYGKPVIGGGTHCTILPEQALSELACDAVCIGEGEFTLTDYLDRLAACESPHGVQGLWFKHNGELICGEPRPVNDDIDGLPDDDWDLWDDFDRQLEVFGMVSFYGTRGCPHECSYCTSALLREILPGNFRLCDPVLYAQRIARQWERYRDRGFRIAWLWDQVFTREPQWLEQFAAEYRRLGLHELLPYSVYLRGDELDEHRARLLSDSGCVVVRIGFESGDDHIRCDIYQKRISLDSYRETSRLCKQYQLSVTGYFILGGPGETWKTMHNTYKLAAELDVEMPTFYVYKPLPRTVAVEKLHQLGGYFVDIWKNKVLDIRFGGMVYTPHLSPRQVELFQWVCAIRFIPVLVGRQIARLGLRYFTLLVSSLRRAKSFGITLFDAYRHFTYTISIQAAIRTWEKRQARERNGHGTSCAD